MSDIAIYLLLGIGGLFLGYSIGIGFRPLYKQPENFIIQVSSSIIGIVLVAIAAHGLNIF